MIIKSQRQFMYGSNFYESDVILTFEKYELTSAVNIMKVFLYILFFFNDVTIFPTASSKAVTIAGILIKLSKLLKQTVRIIGRVMQ